MRIKAVLTAIFVASIVSTLTAAHPQYVAPKEGRIVVSITGLISAKGAVVIALEKSPAAWKTRGEIPSFRTVTINIQHTPDSRTHSATHVFKNVPYGTYAIRLYHDKNSNGKFDQGFLGFPMEWYGFSNNAVGFMAPPSFENATFRLDRPVVTTRIKMKR